MCGSLVSSSENRDPSSAPVTSPEEEEPRRGSTMGLTEEVGKVRGLQVAS